MEAEVAAKGERIFVEQGFLGRLRAWSVHLREHFRFEEVNGFEGGFASPDPEIHELTSGFVRQHRALEARMDDVLARAGAPSGAEDAAELMEELLRFFRQLRQHDAQEDAMLQRIVHGPVDF
jgi:hypothetical protein